MAHRQREWREWRRSNQETVDVYLRARNDRIRHWQMQQAEAEHQRQQEHQQELQRVRDMERQREVEHQRELQRLHELNRQREVDIQREIQRLCQQLETGAKLKQNDDKKK